ncbi:macrophage mannose receptor 1-like [Triplophysa rosa]|nr:macrophage mannose receptor 1-like [Triplophysa rosa]XP_057193332.1 macrophage mannose receptor 1-like [Triplophysa rosa]
MTLTLIQIQILLGVVWKICCAPHAFILIPEQKIWNDARSYCREKHLDLATVQSHDDRSMIQEAADERNLDSYAWIGLYDGLSTWRWSYGKQAMGFTNWQSQEPNRDRTQDACAFITSSGEWIDTSCAEQRFFVCYQRNSLINYHFIKTRKTWLNALQHCKIYNTDLALITSVLENTLVLISTKMEGEAWIGLSRNMWLWSDGTHVSHLSMSWIHTQPDNLYGSESCGYVRADGAIGDCVCSVPRPFFCTQIRKRQTLMVSVTAEDNLTEFTVMAAVEEKINQVLSGKGMDAGSNVTLRTYSHQIFHDEVTEESTSRCEKEPSTA